MNPKREEDRQHAKDIEAMKVQLDINSRNISDLVYYIEKVNDKTDSVLEKVVSLERRIPAGIATKTEVEVMVRSESERMMEKIEEIRVRKDLLGDTHPKPPKSAAVPYIIITILLLIIGWMGHVSYKVLPERIAHKMLTSGADDYWDLHQAALEVLHIGDNHRKGAKRYLKIIRDSENWRALQLVNRIHCNNGIGIIDDLWKICDDSADGYFIHFLDESEKPRAVIILCGGNGKQSINALITEPITRKKLKSIKTIDITRIQDAVDCFAAYENGTWYKLKNNNSKLDKQP